MFSQTDDLQKAIEQVNDNGENAPAPDGEQAKGTGDFAAIQDQLGVPPMPPTEGAGLPPMPNPEAPATEDAPAEAAPAAESPAESVDVNVAPASEAPSTPEAPAADGDLAEVRQNVLRDLIPLMDKVQADPEQKFNIYKDAMGTLHDKGLISGAYKVATQITDESKKAESLMDLMKAIDDVK